jgi:hypothetical protein
MVLASSDRALLGSLVLVRQHVSLEIFEDASTFRQGAETFLASLIVEFVATTLPACS